MRQPAKSAPTEMITRATEIVGQIKPHRRANLISSIAPTVSSRTLMALPGRTLLPLSAMRMTSGQMWLLQHGRRMQCRAGGALASLEVIDGVARRPARDCLQPGYPLARTA